MLAYSNVRASVISLVALCAVSGCQLYFSTGGADADAPKTTANVIFLTTATYDGNLGGRAGADEKCRAAAGAAKLTGTFVAVIGADRESIDPGATSRLSTAQGWVLPRGKAVMNDAADLISGNQWFPIIEDQRGNDVSASNEYWSGTTGLGDPGKQCNQWTDNTNMYSGEYGRGSEAGGLGYKTGECNVPKHLLCAAINLNAPLPAPTRGNQKIVFVSQNMFGINPQGRAMADANCAAEASLAQLDGTYVALLGELNSAAITRVDGLAQYQRTDGVPLGFLSAPASFINRAANRMILNRAVWAEPLAALAQKNCDNWTNADPTMIGATGSATTAGPDAYSNYYSYCNQANSVYCVQQ